MQSSRFVLHSAREAWSHAKAVHHYPFGYITRDEKATPHQAYLPNPRPILLVHGVVHNRSAFFPLRRQMSEWGWSNLFTLNYRTRHGSLTAMVEDLARKVDQIIKETGHPQVDIVAHSLGGLVARYYMTFGEGRGRVKQLITLGTPHRGTESTIFLRLILGGSLYRDLRGQSYFIKTLNDTAVPKTSRIVSLYSRHDKIVWPYVGSKVEGIPKHSYKNLEVDVSGHLSLLYCPNVYELIHEALTEKSYQN